MIYTRILSWLISLGFVAFMSASVFSVVGISLNQQIVACFFLWYGVNSILSRTLFSICNARESGGGLTDKFLHDLYRISFSVLYLALVYYLPGYVSLTADNSLLIKGGFTIPSFFEIILFAVLLFLAVVSYTRCSAEARYGKFEFITSTVRAAMHLFTTYFFVMVYPLFDWENFVSAVTAFLSPIEYFNKFQLVDIFLAGKGSVYIIVAKVILLIVGNFYLHLVNKYYCNHFITHNFFVIAFTLIWCNLFILGLDNILITVLTFDTIAMATVAFVVFHEKQKQFVQSEASLYYILFSVLTSICAYYGIFFIYSHYHSFSFSWYFMMYEGGKAGLPNGFVTLGWYLIGIKLVFLLGTFPFYKYLLDVGSIIYYPSIFYWSVLSKLAVLVNVTKFTCITFIINKEYFSEFWKIILAVSILYGSIMLCHTPNLKVFFAHSSLINISTTILFATLDWKASVFVVLISYSIYAFAMFGLMLFLSCPRRLTPYANVSNENEIDVFENLYWGAQDVVFSRDLNSPGMQKDIFSFFVKGGAGICSLVLMGAAPFAGFMIKFILVTAFLSISSILVCVCLIVGTIYSNVGYYALFLGTAEKVMAYTSRSYREWVMYVDESDMMYFQLIFIFNFYASIFCLSLVF